MTNTTPSLSDNCYWGRFSNEIVVVNPRNSSYPLNLGGREVVWNTLCIPVSVLTPEVLRLLPSGKKRVVGSPLPAACDEALLAVARKVMDVVASVNRESRDQHVSNLHRVNDFMRRTTVFSRAVIARKDMNVHMRLLGRLLSDPSLPFSVQDGVATGYRTLTEVLGQTFPQGLVETGIQHIMACMITPDQASIDLNGGYGKNNPLLFELEDDEDLLRLQKLNKAGLKLAEGIFEGSLVKGKLCQLYLQQMHEAFDGEESDSTEESIDDEDPASVKAKIGLWISSLFVNTTAGENSPLGQVLAELDVDSESFDAALKALRTNCTALQHCGLLADSQENSKLVDEFVDTVLKFRKSESLDSLDGNMLARGADYNMLPNASLEMILSDAVGQTLLADLASHNVKIPVDSSKSPQGAVAATGRKSKKARSRRKSEAKKMPQFGVTDVSKHMVERLKSGLVDDAIQYLQENLRFAALSGQLYSGYLEKNTAAAKIGLSRELLGMAQEYALRDKEDSEEEANLLNQLRRENPLPSYKDFKLPKWAELNVDTGQPRLVVRFGPEAAETVDPGTIAQLKLLMSEAYHSCIAVELYLENLGDIGLSSLLEILGFKSKRIPQIRALSLPKKVCETNPLVVASALRAIQNKGALRFLGLKHLDLNSFLGKPGFQQPALLSAPLDTKKQIANTVSAEISTFSGLKALDLEGGVIPWVSFDPLLNLGTVHRIKLKNATLEDQQLERLRERLPTTEASINLDGVRKLRCGDLLSLSDTDSGHATAGNAHSSKFYVK